MDRRESGIIASRSAGLDTLQKAGVNQRVQRAINGAQADPRKGRTHLLVDLGGIRMIRRVLDGAEHRLPLSGQAQVTQTGHRSKHLPSTIVRTIPDIKIWPGPLPRQARLRNLTRPVPNRPPTTQLHHLEPLATATLHAARKVARSQNARLALVGGAVRDLLLGKNRLPDLDLVIENADPMTLASALATLLQAPPPQPTPFLSAQVHGPLRLDITLARREHYPRPGDDPQIQKATLEEDLSRRDFTINAIAYQLEPQPALIDLHGGRADLETGLLRTLHPSSFREDPTRVLRAARFATRYNLTFEQATLASARQEAQLGCNRLAAPRLRLELDAITREPDPPAVWAKLAANELLGVLDLVPPPTLVLHRALTADPSPKALWLAILAAQPTPQEAVARFGYPASDATRAQAIRAVTSGRYQPLDAEALAAARLWRPNLSPSDLEPPPKVRGADLIQLGLTPGPRVGQVLARLREARERGEVNDLAAEKELARKLVAQIRNQTPEDPN